jgi:hypothetical protein
MYPLFIVGQLSEEFRPVTQTRADPYCIRAESSRNGDGCAAAEWTENKIMTHLHIEMFHSVV